MAEMVLKGFLPALITLALGTAVSAQDEERDVADQYRKSCAVCHANGAANAPRTGNVADWEPRLAKGMEVLVSSVEKGLNAMPPKGMCFDCSTEDYRELIQLMAAPGK